MLRSGGTAALSSIVDPATNQLQVKPSEVKRVLRAHYAGVFALPAVSSDQAASVGEVPAAWAASVYAVPERIEPAWYAGLMAECSPGELLRLVKSLGPCSAPGLARVSAGVWKLAVTGSSAVQAVVLAC